MDHLKALAVAAAVPLGIGGGYYLGSYIPWWTPLALMALGFYLIALSYFRGAPNRKAFLQPPESSNPAE